LISAASSVAQHQEKGQPDISLTISAPRDSAKVGSDVLVNIALANITKHIVYVGLVLLDNGAECEYTVDARDLKGNLAPYAKHGRALRGVPLKGEVREHLCADFSGFPKELQPGETQDDAILASGIYDLTKPGKYTIQVSRTYGEAKTVVKSNTITLTVTN
jgi:hypothetical protein